MSQWQYLMQKWNYYNYLASGLHARPTTVRKLLLEAVSKKRRKV